VTRVPAIVLLTALVAMTSRAAPGRRPLEAKSSQRQYAPDRDADIHHVALDITPDFNHRTISGQPNLRFTHRKTARRTPTGRNRPGHPIGGFQPENRRLRGDGGPSGHFVCGADSAGHGGHRHHSLQSAAAEGPLFSHPGNGLQRGDEHLFTQGEAIDERYWYPGYDSPNEKFTTENHLPSAGWNDRPFQRPPGFGGKGPRGIDGLPLEPGEAARQLPRLAGRRLLQEGRRQVQGRPLAFYVPPSDINEAPNSFRDTRDIMEFYENEIGLPFPWAKYYQVVVQDFMEGGMENTSITTLTERTLSTEATENLRSSQGLVAHEMAHQWFGDWSRARTGATFGSMRVLPPFTPTFMTGTKTATIPCFTASIRRRAPSSPSATTSAPSSPASSQARTTFRLPGV